MFDSAPRYIHTSFQIFTAQDSRIYCVAEQCLLRAYYRLWNGWGLPNLQQMHLLMHHQMVMWKLRADNQLWIAKSYSLDPGANPRWWEDDRLHTVLPNLLNTALKCCCWSWQTVVAGHELIHKHKPCRSKVEACLSRYTDKSIQATNIVPAICLWRAGHKLAAYM